MNFRVAGAIMLATVGVFAGCGNGGVDGENYYRTIIHHDSLGNVVTTIVPITSDGQIRTNEKMVTTNGIGAAQEGETVNCDSTTSGCSGYCTNSVELYDNLGSELCIINDGVYSGVNLGSYRYPGGCRLGCGNWGGKVRSWDVNGMTGAYWKLGSCSIETGTSGTATSCEQSATTFDFVVG